ncbi:MAG: outer membrane beta-barrel protein [Saprospiraceae bacterium]
MKEAFLIILVFLISYSPGNGQFLINIETGLSFSKMGNRFTETSTFSEPRFSSRTELLYRLKAHKFHLDLGLGYSLEGHSFKVLNYFEAERIKARLSIHNLNLSIVPSINLHLGSRESGPLGNISLLTGVFYGYIFSSKFKYHKDPVISDIQLKPLNTGLILGIRTSCQAKSKLPTGFDLSLKYYWGLVNIQKGNVEWYTRSLMCSITLPLSKGK